MRSLFSKFNVEERKNKNMSDEKHRVQGTIVFNDDESYEAYRSGDGKFNNGLRRDNGTMYTQPDFEEDNHTEDNEEEKQYSEKLDENLSDDLITKTIIAVTGIAVGVAAVKIAPRIKGWWNTSVRSSLKDKWNKSRGRVDNNSKSSESIVITDVEEIDKVNSSINTQKIDDTFEKYKSNITSKEAQKELIEIFILSVLLVKKIRKLSNSNLLDEEILIKKVTSKEFIEGINQALLSNPNILEKNSEFLSEIMEREISEDGIYIPIESEKLKKQLWIVSNRENM